MLDQLPTKHGKVVIYHTGLSPVNLHNLVKMWSREATRQIKNIPRL